jgi:hypothetical protein
VNGHLLVLLAGVLVITIAALLDSSPAGDPPTPVRVRNRP